MPSRILNGISSHLKTRSEVRITLKQRWKGWHFFLHNWEKQNCHRQDWSPFQKCKHYTAQRLQGAPLGITPCQVSFQLELSVRMSDVKCRCQKAPCLACPCWQVGKWSVLPDQYKRMAPHQCHSSHICRLTINKFSCRQSDTVLIFSGLFSLSESLALPCLSHYQSKTVKVCHDGTFQLVVC